MRRTNPKRNGTCSTCATTSDTLRNFCWLLHVGIITQIVRQSIFARASKLSPATRNRLASLCIRPTSMHDGFPRLHGWRCARHETIMLQPPVQRCVFKAHLVHSFMGERILYFGCTRVPSKHTDRASGGRAIPSSVFRTHLGMLIGGEVTD